MKEAGDSSRKVPAEFFEVTDEKQARILSDPASIRYIEPFLGQERSISQAAEEAKCSLDAMHYRVKRFVAAGLLKVARVEPRAGRAIRHYRTVADAFFVPFSLTSFANLEDSIHAMLEPFNRRVIRSNARLLMQTGLEGRRIYRHGDGSVWSDAAADPQTAFQLDGTGDRLGYDFSVSTRMTQESARQLQRELYALFEKYTEQPDKHSGQPFLWRVVLLPDHGE